MNLVAILSWKDKIQKELDNGDFDEANYLLEMEMPYELFDDYTEIVKTLYPEFEVSLDGTLKDLIKVGEFEYNEEEYVQGSSN